MGDPTEGHPAHEIEAVEGYGDDDADAPGDEPEQAEHRGPARRALRLLWLVLWRSFVGVVVLVGLLLVVLQLLLTNGAFADWVIAQALPIANDALPGRIAVGGFEGKLGSRIVLHDVSIWDERDELATRVKRLELRWSVWSLTTLRVDAELLQLDDPEVWVRLREDGTVNFVGAFVAPPPEDATPAPPVEGGAGNPLVIDVGSVALKNARVVVEPAGAEPLVFEGIDLDAAYRLQDLDSSVQIRGLGVTMRAPLDIPPLRLKGDAVVGTERVDLQDVVIDWQDTQLALRGGLGFSGPDFDLVLGLTRLEFDDLQAIAEGIPLQGGVTGELTAKGPLTDLKLAGKLATFDGGELAIRSGRFALNDPMEHAIDLGMRDFDVATLLGIEAIPGPFTGRVKWHGKGTALDTLAGTAVLDLQPITYQGVPLGPIGLDASLANAALATSRLQVGIAGGQVQGEASAHLTKSEFAADLTGELPLLGELAGLTGGALKGGGASLQVRASGSWAAPITVRTGGRLSAQNLRVPSTEIGEADATWDLALELGEGLPSVLGRAKVDAERIDVNGERQVRDARVIADVQGKAGDIDLLVHRGDDIEVDFDGWADWSAAPDVTVRGDRLRVEVGDDVVESAKEDPFGVVYEDGSVRVKDLDLDVAGASLVAKALYDPAGPLEADVKLRGFQLAAVDRILAVVAPGTETKVSGSVKNLTVVARGTLREPELRVDLSGRELVLDGRPPLSADVALVANPGLVSGTAKVPGFADLRLGKLPLSLRLDGKGAPAVLDPAGAWDLELTLPQTPVVAVGELVPTALPELLDAAQYGGGLTIEGTTEHPKVGLSVSLSGVTFAERSTNARVTARIEDDRLALDGTQVRTATEGTILTLEGGGSVFLGDVLLDALGPPERPKSGRSIPLDDFELTAKLNATPTQLLHEVVPALRPLSGDVRGRVDVSGTLDAPRIAADLALVGGRAGQVKLGETGLQLDFAEQRVDLDLKMAVADGGQLAVTGGVTVPFANPPPPSDVLLGSEDLDIRFDGQDFPLEVLTSFVEGTSDPRGVIGLSGSITGSILDPVPDVHLLTADSGVCFDPTKICYRELALDVAVKPDRIALKKVSVLAEPIVINPLDRASRPVNKGQYGPVSLTGGIEAQLTREGLDLGGFDLELVLGDVSSRDPNQHKGFWAMYSRTIKAQALGRVKVTGDFPALQVGGTVDINNVDVDMGQGDVNRSVAPMMLPTNLAVHRQSTRRGPGEREVVVRDLDTADEPTMLDEILANSDVDLTVNLTNNNRVKLNVGLMGQGAAGAALNTIGNVAPDLILKGSVRAQLYGGEPLLEGRVETHRGSKLTALTKGFDLVDGSGIDFSGQPLESQLDFRALFPSKYGDIFIVVNGPVSAPNIQFESDALPDQADIMSVLLVGKPLDELSAAEGNNTMSTIAGALSGFTNSLFGEQVPLDSFAVDFGDDFSSGSVEAGKAITPRIFLVTRFRWGADPDENTVEAQVEWSITRRVYLEGMLGDKLKGAVDLIFKIQY